MSTIVVTEDQIAWDSQVTVNDTRLLYGRNKVEVIDGVVFGAVGHAIPLEEFAKWWRNGRPKHLLPEGEWDLVVIDCDDVWTVSHDDGGRLSKVTSFPFALGTGGNYAIGALDAGADIETAVNIAAKYDIYTGGPVNYLDLDEVEFAEPKSLKERVIDRVLCWFNVER